MSAYTATFVLSPGRVPTADPEAMSLSTEECLSSDVEPTRTGRSHRPDKVQLPLRALSAKPSSFTTTTPQPRLGAHARRAVTWLSAPRSRAGPSADTSCALEKDGRADLHADARNLAAPTDLAGDISRRDHGWRAAGTSPPHPPHLAAAEPAELGAAAALAAPHVRLAAQPTALAGDLSRQGHGRRAAGASPSHLPPLAAASGSAAADSPGRRTPLPARAEGRVAHAERRRAHAELAITARRAGCEGSPPAPALLLGATAGFLPEAAAAARASGLAGACPRIAAQLVNLAGALPRRWRAAGASVALLAYVTDKERVAARGEVAAARLRLPDKESVQEDNKIIECRVRVDYHYHYHLASRVRSSLRSRS